MKFKGLLVIILVSIIAFSCKKSTKEEMKDDAKDAIESVEKAADKAVEGVKNTTNEVVEEVKEAANDAADGVEEVANDVADAVGDAVDDVVDWATIKVHYPKDEKLAKLVYETKGTMAKKNKHVNKIFSTAYAYAIFPKIGKAGFIIGGAGGHGLVFVNHKVIGRATLMQATVGAQIGGQQYSEFILFKNKAALDRFKNNKVKLAGEASAVALDKAVSDNINYQDGVAVYTYSNKGLMAEATLGAQKFKYKDGIK